MKENKQINDIIFYSTPTGNVKVEVIFNDETFWLSQRQMADLFGVKVPAVSKHLVNIFENEELDESSVVSILETTAKDGNTMKGNNQINDIIFYNTPIWSVRTGI